MHRARRGYNRMHHVRPASDSPPCAMTRTESSFVDLRLRWRLLLRGLRRKNLRNNEVALIMASAALGLAIGLGVIVIQVLVQRIHELSFAIPPGTHLSENDALDWWRVLLLPIAGGALSGGVSMLIRRW